MIAAKPKLFFSFSFLLPSLYEEAEGVCSWRPRL